MIIDSARKHGIPDVDIIHAFDHPTRYRELDEGFTLVIGPARSGQLLELGFVDAEEGPVIVHAMPARRRYLR